MSAAAPEIRPAASDRRRVFALVFGVSFAVLYVVCDIAGFPMFTFHPGSDRIDLGFTRARPDEGPAMYWYGWIATSAVGAFIIALVATLLPQKVGGKIPLALAWIVPIALLPVLIYSLKFYWRW
jgi:hypothetical protein